MAGSPAATLQGWAIPLEGAQWLEHTYVTSSCGLKWGCWGRDAGGYGLSAATGSSVVADCLSQSNSQAGIVYGITGVCHQTANRILHPAKVTVVGCQGYPLSSFLFGVYGQGNWLQLPVCYSFGTAITSGGTNAKPFASSSGRNHSSMSELYNSRVIHALASPISREDGKLAELSALVEMALGYPLEPKILADLYTIQLNLWWARSCLVTNLQNREITPDQYLNRLHEALQSAMDQSRALLGEERFQMIFGEAGKNPNGLVNRTVFMEQMK